MHAYNSTTHSTTTAHSRHAVAALQQSDDRTLMSKLREHWYEKPITPPPEKADIYGKIFSWFIFISLCYTQCYHLVPFYHEDDITKSKIYSAVSVFFIFEAALNWLCTSRKTCSFVTPQRLEKVSDLNIDNLPEGWRECLKCQLPSPPRSHHCKVCQSCVLKRDHHCFFTGTCVGFYNQRHFIVLCMYSMICSLFFTPYLAAYLNDSVPFLSYEGIYNYVPPIPFMLWFVGQYSTFNLIVLIQLYSLLLCGSASTGFFIWHILIILRGQTSNEFIKNKQIFKMKPIDSIRSVFGPYWAINFIWPIPTLPSCDGFTWVKWKDHKSN